MKILIVANWKMNPQTLAEAKALFGNVKNTGAVICPPSIYISDLKTKGAQDCFWENEGAYTGGISPVALKDLGCEYVILGHSERRRILKETDEMINKKIKAVLKIGLKPILCVSDLKQLKNSLSGIKEKVIVAFEPVSAVGTRVPYDVEKARKIRSLINYPMVLYGGSVDEKNVKSYLDAGFNGVLVGQASLDPQKFSKLAKAAAN